MEILDIQTCPLCGSNRTEGVFVCTDRYASGEEFHIRQCCGCSFRFTSDAPVESCIGRYYETPEYISHSDTRHGAMNAVYHQVRSLMLQRKASLIARQTGLKEGHLLDIGSGTGYFADAMQQRHWHVDTIEKSAEARAFAHDKFGLATWGEEAYGQLQDGSYDAITLWHVMEHIEHLNNLWDGLHRWLKDDGVLVVAGPNCASYDARHYGADWAAYDVPRHLWHFTPDTMTTMAAKHGFRTIGIRPMPFDAFYISMLTEQHLGRNLSFVRGLCTGTMALLHSWANKKESSSLTYIFKKSQGL